MAKNPFPASLIQIENSRTKTSWNRCELAEKQHDLQVGTQRSSDREFYAKINVIFPLNRKCLSPMQNLIISYRQQ